MTTSIVIPGLSSTTKRPAFYAETRYAAGAISAGSIPLTLLLVGNKTSAGSMTADGTPQLITSVDDVDTLAGPGSEIGTLAYGIDGHGGALATAGVAIWIAAITEASSAPSAATATVTIAGSWSTSGTLKYRVSGAPISVGVGPVDTVAIVAQAIVDAINGNPRLPFTAARSGGVVTITTKNQSLRQNWHSLFQDVTNGPSGLTSTLTGGSSMTGGGKHFTGGAGSDSPTALLAAIAATQYDRIALACGDATLDGTNIALWKAQMSTQAGPTVGILGHAIVASSDTLTNAASLTVTTLNDARWNLLHLLNSETHPTSLAGAFAAIRCSAEQEDPDAAFDDVIIPGAAPQSAAADRPSSTVIETALGEGVTELYTGDDGTVRVSRAIVTRCRTGSTPDYRVLDTGDAIVPDFVRGALKLLWLTDIKPNNPRVDANPPAELKEPLAGVLTPSIWNGAVMKLLKEFERGEGVPSGLPILTGVDANPAISQYDTIAKRIMSIVPTVPRANNHSVGVSVRQLTTA